MSVKRPKLDHCRILLAKLKVGVKVELGNFPCLITVRRDLKIKINIYLLIMDHLSNDLVHILLCKQS